MKMRQSIFLITALAMIALLVACSSSSSTPPPPPPPAISVALSPTPPASLQPGAQTPLTANVSNDSSATPQVTWSVTCGSADCGNFSSTTTASGTATTYTAPAAVPTGNTVTVTATSVTDTTKSASATITIAGPALADGNYVFSVSGFDAATGAPYSVAGAFTVSGGSITGGEQDFVDFNIVVSDVFKAATSSISTTADGNLQIVLDTQDLSIGVGGVETFNGALTCTCKALITEFDASATASGTLDLQTSTTAPSGGYAFGVAGVDFNEVGLAIGGILNVDGPGTISGTGSIFDANDGFSGTTFQGETFAASTVTAPDALGRVTFTLNATDSVDFPEIDLVGYIVDATRIRLVETSDLFAGTTGGTALGQGGNTGSFTSISGNSYVAGLAGFDNNFVLQAAGVFTANADGSVSGTINYNDLSGIGVQAPAPLVGGATYTLDSTGRVTMTGITDGIITPVTLQFYLSGDGHATVISMDGSDTLGGLAFGQTGPFDATSFSGTYVLNTGGTDFNEVGPLNSVGPVTADGIGALTGTNDLNWLNFATGPVTFPDLTVSGTFTADPSGVFTGTVTGLDVTTTNNADAFTYYVERPPAPGIETIVIGIETDPNQLTLGLFSLVLE
ncbi:MAG: hypothetical protein WB510_08025 [Candidatus Sulfotelmatobacter sp.]